MRRFVYSVGMAVCVAGCAVILVTGQLTNNPHEPYYGSEHQHLMLLLFGLLVLGFICCSVSAAADHRRERRPGGQPLPSERSSSSSGDFYNDEVYRTAELPSFLSKDAPQRLPGASVPEEWPVGRQPPEPIAQDRRLRLMP